MSKELKEAEKRFRIIHGKEPRKLIEPKKRWPWPQSWALSGQPTCVYYRSDRQKPDGRMVNYYHDHDNGNKLWEPRGLRDFGVPGSPRVYLPHVLTCLGEALGIDIERVDGKKNYIECSVHDFICTNAKGNILVIVDTKSGPWALITGKNLEVGPYGIEH